MQKLIKGLRIVAIIMVCFILVMIAAGYFFEDKIKDLTVKSLNRNLRSEIKVSDINFSMLRCFPFASVEFANVYLAGSNKDLFAGKPMLQARSFRMLFSLMNLFKKSYSIKKIELADASVNILVNKNGFSNYDIFRSDSSSGELHFDIEEIELSNIVFYQNSELSKFRQEFMMHSGTAAGNFSASAYTLNMDARLYYKTLSVNEVAYLDNKETEIKTAVSINTASGIYTINQSHLKIAAFSFSAAGNIDDSGEETMLNLELNAKNINSERVLSLLPKTVFPEAFFTYRFNGSFNVNMKVSGYSSKTTTPSITVKFETKGTDIIPPGKEYALRNVAMKGIYGNKKSSSNPVSYIVIKNFSAMLNGKPAKANVEIENFSRPSFSIQADAEVSLEALQRFIRMNSLHSAEGTLSIHGSCKGTGNNMASYKSSGTLRINDAAFYVKEKPLKFKDVNGYFIFNGNDVTVNNFSLLAGSSDLVCTGNIKNLFGCIFQKNQTAQVDVTITGNTLEVNELTASDISAKADTLYRLDFPTYINADIKAGFDKVVYGKFVAQGMKGNLSLKNKALTAHFLAFNAVDGTIYMQGGIDASMPDSLIITCDASVKKLNIQKLFYQTGNFNQSVLIDKNISGSVTATVQLATAWSKTLHINSSRIMANSNIIIENGELHNFSPMLKLSKFVKGTDLREIKFSTLKNDIEIRNRKIFFPKMEINSSALNITAHGTHDFDNMIDYKIQMRLNQVIGKKVKQLNTEFGTIEDDGLGGLNLFLTMSGPADNPKFAYDRKSVEQNIAKTIKEEKKNFIKIIKDEFKGNKPKKDSVKTAKEELQIEEE